jgi:predicted RNA-binding Zn ribbon-like protein
MEKIMGKAIFEGIVIGEPYLRGKKQMGIEEYKIEPHMLEDEIKRFEVAIKDAKQELKFLKSSLKGKIKSNDLKILNKYMEYYKFKKNIIVENNQYKIINSPVENTGDILIYEIISSFFLLISENKFDRLNFCKNPDCRWIFYDESKNKTRKWCDNTCASLMKVRRYREKQK